MRRQNGRNEAMDRRLDTKLVTKPHNRAAQPGQLEGAVALEILDPIAARVDGVEEGYRFCHNTPVQSILVSGSAMPCAER